MRVSFLPLLAALLLLAACNSGVRTFDDGGAAAGVAVIVPENRHNRARAAGPFGGGSAGTSEVRVRIGGRSLGGFSSRFAVRPGRQDLAVAFVDDPAHLPDQLLQTRAVTLSFDAEVGHTYAVRGRATYGSGRPSVQIWIVDAATRRTVASVQVPDASAVLEWDPQDPTDDN